MRREVRRNTRGTEDEIARQSGKRDLDKMKYYNREFDWNDSNLVSQYDELPLWSSYFAQILLDNIPMDNFKYYLDVGCGTGFPLIDICQQIGNGCKGYGIDPWGKAVERTRIKLSTLGLENIEIIESSATNIPFENNFFGLITSNVGINNFSEPEKVLAESYRVLKSNGHICITSNLTGTFQEFYDIYKETLIDIGLEKYSDALERHINHRGTPQSISTMFENTGFKILRKIETSFSLRFLNGTSFLNHSVIMSGFLGSWKSMFGNNETEMFFARLENNLNNYSKTKGELKLKVPMLYLECTK